MDAPSSAEHLVPWDVPFAKWEYFEMYAMKEGLGESFTIVVTPRPIGRLLQARNYPKYLVRFDWVITFLFYAEPCAPTERAYYSIPGWVQGVGVYQWINSPWIRSYSGCFHSHRDEMRHYVLLAESDIAEVISIGDARIEKIDSKRIIDGKFEV